MRLEIFADRHGKEAILVNTEAQPEFQPPDEDQHGQRSEYPDQPDALPVDYDRRKRNRARNPAGDVSQDLRFYWKGQIPDKAARRQQYKYGEKSVFMKETFDRCAPCCLVQNLDSPAD